MTGSFISDYGKTELTLSEAEEIKTLYGIPKSGDQLSENPKITSQQILTLIGPKIEQMVTEINRSFDYYRQELHGGKVDRVLLVGGGAQLKGLDDFLSNELGLEVKCGDPFEGIALLDPSLIGSKAEAQVKVFAIGAALGNARDINFLSKASSKKSGFSVPKFFAKIATIMIIVGTISAVAYFADLLKTQKHRVEAKTQKTAAQMKDVREILSVEKLRQQRPDWGKVLKTFSSVSQNIYLTELSYKNDELFVRGVVTGSGEDKHEILSSFLSSLQANVAKDTRLRMTRNLKDTTDQYAFEIVSTIKTVK
jgi:cell division ATPase FtsA